ncbi:MAG: hypothetical protein K2X48_08830 [Chitinophagaceae bacterium]|nr:hypothetical protein [Chitinophagaceae bacterium]
MTTITITIKKKKALKALEDLKANDLIDFSTQKKPVIRKHSKEKILTHLASEKVLLKDWLTNKEDKAWQHL